MRLRAVGGADPGWFPPIPRAAGPVPTPAGSVWLAPVPDVEGFWLEVDAAGNDPSPIARQLLPFVATVLDAARERALLSEELATRSEEIDLLYAISEILGRNVSLAEAADSIVAQVSGVVGARRASIMVYDETTATLRSVAERGFTSGGRGVVAVADPSSIAARVFRDRRIIVRDPGDPPPLHAAGDRGYLGEAFVSVPICHAEDGGPVRCVGVINLTDRVGDRFTAGDRKLVSAIANQIGAAIENARLTDLDRRQQRLRRELELAHDLQLRLLPPPTVLGGAADVAALCVPADSVGGDFYTFSRLAGGCVGVMLGDISSHGFSAALVMALVLSAAGIHAAAALTPAQTLAAILESIAGELASTEMYLTAFYGVLDPAAGRLTYANAGHPHAFRIGADGSAERLPATAPPLGLGPAGPLGQSESAWHAGTDLLCLWTDGLVDALDADGRRYGERRLIEGIVARRQQPPAEIVAAVTDDVAAFVRGPRDDRTILILRI